MKKLNKRNSHHCVRRIILAIIIVLLLFIGCICFYSAKWVSSVYGNIGFNAILYTLFSDLKGVQSGLVSSYVIQALFPALMITAAIGFLLIFSPKKRIVAYIKKKYKIVLYPLYQILSLAIASAFCVILVWNGAQRIYFFPWLDGVLHAGNFYEKEYVDPSMVSIEFPEQKHNLIYIYVESMETTFLSEELGGGLELYNLIPELYSLAKENINFSDNNDVGGFYPNLGSSWTIGAMVSQTAGIPLLGPVNGNDYGNYTTFLPGVDTLMDVLHENGYYQALMMGSEAAFAGRDLYYSQHGIDVIYDYNTAQKDKIIDEDYYVWWGMEDAYLYEYAKQKLTEISQSEEPFAFSMLTADTHHVGGYYCKYCQDTYEEQYENVISCASRQLDEFVSWLQEQDFYKDTTIVIVGDHCSMDNEYISKKISPNYTRHVYNCIINSCVETENSKNREISTFDMFPTTLAAMGCQIEGDKLGLGTNLFSGQETLAEKYGYEQLDEELGKRSNYYYKNFLLSYD